jgi:hypothetical protein
MARERAALQAAHDPWDLAVSSDAREAEQPLKRSTMPEVRDDHNRA